MYYYIFRREIPEHIIETSEIPVSGGHLLTQSEFRLTATEIRDVLKQYCRSQIDSSFQSCKDLMTSLDSVNRRFTVEDDKQPSQGVKMLYLFQLTWRNNHLYESFLPVSRISGNTIFLTYPFNGRKKYSVNDLYVMNQHNQILSLKYNSAALKDIFTKKIYERYKQYSARIAKYSGLLSRADTITIFI